MFAAFAMFLSCVVVATAQTTRGTLASTTLEPTTYPQWLRQLGYKADQVYPLNFAPTGCPLIEVTISGVRLNLLFDTGTAMGFVITNNAPPVPHRVEQTIEQTNPDGSHLGESLRIRVETMSVLNKTFSNVTGTMAEWHLYSSLPFQGTVGLDYFLDRRLTLDYRAQKVAVTTAPLPNKLDLSHYVSLDLVQPPPSQGNILYARAKLNGRDVMVYFDTGSSASFIDPSYAEGMAKVERPGRFKIFREHVPLQIGGHTFILDELREDSIRRGTGFDTPIAVILGSDVLSCFLITIDLRAKRLILAVAK